MLRQKRRPKALNPPRTITKRGRIGEFNQTPRNQAAIGAANTIAQKGLHKFRPFFISCKLKTAKCGDTNNQAINNGIKVEKIRIPALDKVPCLAKPITVTRNSVTISPVNRMATCLNSSDGFSFLMEVRFFESIIFKGRRKENYLTASFRVNCIDNQLLQSLILS